MSEGKTTRYLFYKKPFDWKALLSTFRAHQLPYLESIDEDGYERLVETTHGTGWFRVEHDAGREAVRLSLRNGTEGDLERISVSVRRMFDLDADPALINASMQNDRYLYRSWKRDPGIRVARTWSGIETIVTTVLGQLVSVSFGRILIDELMRAAGAKSIHPKTKEPIYLFPTAHRLLNADLSLVRTSEARRNAIRLIAGLTVDGSLREDGKVSPKDLRKVLRSVPGVGPWTSEYVAMRGFHDNDAFPATDYGLKQVLQQHPEIDLNRVRPWRAYAAAILWREFAAMKGAPYESVV